MKRRFFQAAVVSILLYGCTTWTLTKQLEEKRDGNYTRMFDTNIEQLLAATPPQSTDYTATCPPRKLSELDKPDMQDTAGEAGKSS